MPLPKLVVRYRHDPAELTPIFLAVVRHGPPGDGEWVPVLRDVIDDKAVVWIRHRPLHHGEQVWLKDRHGQQPVRSSHIGTV